MKKMARYFFIRPQDIYFPQGLHRGKTHWGSGIRKIPGCGQICLKLRICATPGYPMQLE